MSFKFIKRIYIDNVKKYFLSYYKYQFLLIKKNLKTEGFEPPTS